MRNYEGPPKGISDQLAHTVLPHTQLHILMQHITLRTFGVLFSCVYDRGRAHMINVLTRARDETGSRAAQCYLPPLLLRTTSYCLTAYYYTHYCDAMRLIAAVILTFALINGEGVVATTHTATTRIITSPTNKSEHQNYSSNTHNISADELV
jgi:hypothetical protein